MSEIIIDHLDEQAKEQEQAEKRVRLHVRRRVRHQKSAKAEPIQPTAASVRPQLSLIVQRAIPNLADVDPAVVAEYTEQFVQFVKDYTGWDINVERETIELRLADLLALVAPAVEFALKIKGKDVTEADLEQFVLSLIRAIVLRVNFYAKTNFLIDDGILENLAVTFRNVYAALRKDWSSIDQQKQTNAFLTLFARCLPGCIAAFRKADA